MVIKSVKLNAGKMMATLEDGLLTFDVQIPESVVSVQDVIDLMVSSAKAQRASKIVGQLQHLAEVELSDKVAVFAALHNASSAPALAVPADPSPADQKA